VAAYGYGCDINGHTSGCVDGIPDGRRVDRSQQALKNASPGINFNTGQTPTNPGTCFCSSALCNDAAFTGSTTSISASAMLVAAATLMVLRR
jgi:hypothetical protein